MDKTILERLDNLESQMSQIFELFNDYKQQKTEKQLSFPLDFQTLNTLKKYFLSLSKIIISASASGAEFENLLLSQDNKTYVISTNNNLTKYTVDPSSDILSFGINIGSGLQNSFTVGTLVQIGTDNIVPAPLQEILVYMVVSVSGNTGKLASVINNIVFTAPITSTSTSATLTSNWLLSTGTYYILFDDNEVRTATFTNGNTAVTWTGGLVNNVGIHANVYGVVDIINAGTGTQYISTY